MQPIATTRVQLFPDAPDDAPLAARRPPRIPFSARTGFRFVIATMLTFGALLAIVVLGMALGPDAFGDYVGSNDLPVDDDGAVAMFLGNWVDRVLWGVLVIGAVGYAVLRGTILLSYGRDTRIAWATYAAQRGLRIGRRTAITTTELSVFENGTGRQWTAMLTGRLRGDVDAVIGATAWTTGAGKSRERHRAYFVHLQLPRAVAEIYPGSSLTRFLRGITDADLAQLSESSVLRLESAAFDDACELRVAGSSDDVRWRELFDPITLAGLEEWYDAEWQHAGADIVFVAGGRRHASAPVETLDALCLTAAFMYERFLTAARGDVVSVRRAG